MEEFRISSKEAGKRLDVFLTEKKKWPRFFFMKQLKAKKIKVNGKKVEPSYRILAGDVVTSYVLDEKKEPKPVEVVYEDEEILVLYKPSGLLCLDVTGKEKDTLFDRAKAYLQEKGEGTPTAVHRIDFNTEGLFLLAKNENVGHFLERMFRERHIHKTYLCVVLGQVKPTRGRLENQLFKDAKENKVYVVDKPVQGSKTAILEYEKVTGNTELSLVRLKLITGRTHQIRAQMAHLGFPLLGDHKYGKKEINKSYGENGQLLCAYMLEFDFPKDGPLHHLSGTVLQVPRISFVKKYFKGTNL